MYTSMKHFCEEAAKMDVIPMGVARAEGVEILKAMAQCQTLGLIDPVLFGDESEIRRLMAQHHICGDWRIVHCDTDEAVMEAMVAEVDAGTIKGIVKGHINSGVFMRTIVRDKSINRKGFLHHMGAYKVPMQEKVFFTSDSGINILPSQEQKEWMLCNCVEALHSMGIEEPKVAFLCANEAVSPKMPATVDADTIARKYNGKGCIVEGPIAFDVATSKAHAADKHLNSQVSGEVDLFIFPNIEAGNIVSKCWIDWCHAELCGVVLGCEIPISMGSRTDSMETKVNSIALAKLLSK